MIHTQEDRTLALAGVYQSVKLVQEVARSGTVADAQLSALLETLFRFDAPNVIDVYGDLSNLKKGLNAIIDQLSGSRQDVDMEITRYVINMFHLERVLNKSSATMDKLASELQKTQDKMDYFHVSHENIIASLAEIYQQIISPAGPKIMVQGEPNYLSQQSNANKIRALLFAGIRSAVLWRQCGGGRMQLLFSRNKYINTAKQLLNTI